MFISQPTGEHLNWRHHLLSCKLVGTSDSFNPDVFSHPTTTEETRRNKNRAQNWRITNSQSTKSKSTSYDYFQDPTQKRQRMHPACIAYSALQTNCRHSGSIVKSALGNRRHRGVNVFVDHRNRIPETDLKPIVLGLTHAFRHFFSRAREVQGTEIGLRFGGQPGQSWNHNARLGRYRPEFKIYELSFKIYNTG